MADCLHEQLRHDHYQVNTANPQAPVFDVIRCKQCNMFLAAFPLDRQSGSLVAMESGIQSMQKTLLKIEKLLGPRPKSNAKR
jgi:hypothetical protein